MSFLRASREAVSPPPQTFAASPLLLASEFRRQCASAVDGPSLQLFGAAPAGASPDRRRAALAEIEVQLGLPSLWNGPAFLLRLAADPQFREMVADVAGCCYAMPGLSAEAAGVSCDALREKHGAAAAAFALAQAGGDAADETPVGAARAAGRAGVELMLFLDPLTGPWMRRFWRRTEGGPPVRKDRILPLARAAAGALHEG